LSAGPENVRHVLVRGRFLKKDSALVTLDPAEVAALAREAAEAVVARGPGRAEVTY